MTSDTRLLSERFPRCSKYNPEWILAGVSGGACALWLTEWLAGTMDLRPSMRALDLGYVRAVGRRGADARLDEPIAAISAHYTPASLLRGPE